MVLVPTDSRHSQICGISHLSQPAPSAILQAGNKAKQNGFCNTAESDSIFELLDWFASVRDKWSCWFQNRRKEIPSYQEDFLQKVEVGFALTFARGGFLNMIWNHVWISSWQSLWRFVTYAVFYFNCIPALIQPQSFDYNNILLKCALTFQEWY